MISHRSVATATGTSATLVDSISFVTDADAGHIVICASHGGASSGEYAGKYHLGLVVFNDAGVGKEEAGIEALRLLERKGVAACAVSHESARIGDVLDQWQNGIVSHVNRIASSRIHVGMAVQAAVDSWADIKVESA